MSRFGRSAARVVGRRGPNPKLLKLREQAKARARRAAATAKEHRRELTAVAVAGAYGLAKGRRVKLPTAANLEPAVLYGPGLYVIGCLSKGLMADLARAAGASLTGIAVYEATKNRTLRQLPAPPPLSELPAGDLSDESTAGYPIGIDELEEA